MNKTRAETQSRPAAFTLVELLVVVAIIALLVAILMPTLSKAKEQARMALCKTNLRGLSVAFGNYVGENNQWYPAASAYGGIIYGDGAGPEYAWDTILYPYYDNFGLIYCPSDKIDRTDYYGDYNVPQEKRYPKSYGMNANVSAMGPSQFGQQVDYTWPRDLKPPYPWPAKVEKASTVTNPAETILLADMWESDYGISYGSTSPYYHYAPNIYGAYQGSWMGLHHGEDTVWAGRMPTCYHRNNDAANFLFCDGSVKLLAENNPNITADSDYYYYFREKP